MAFDWELLDALAQEAILVLSTIVLLFWIFYTVILYKQLKAGTVRKDWRISTVFYAGIALLVFSNTVLAMSKLYHTPLGEHVSTVVTMLSMLTFIYGFYLRMKTAVEPYSFTDLGKNQVSKRGNQHE